MNDTIITFLTNTVGTVRYSASTVKHISVTLLLSVVLFSAFIFLSFPVFTYELLSSDIRYLLYVYYSLIDLEILTYGYIGFGLIVLYSVLSSVFIVNTIGAYRIRKSTSSSYLGVLPGLIITGCVGCGAGLLGVFGFFGLTSLFPFGGLGLRVGFVILLFGFLGYYGRPDTEVSS